MIVMSHSILIREPHQLYLVQDNKRIIENWFDVMRHGDVTVPVF